MSLIDLRKQIDTIDDQIIDLLEKRLKIAKEVRKFKKQTADENREKEILAKIHSQYIKDIYMTIFKNSKKVQEENNDI
ncbi:MAG: chorismate mutase [Parachlamydiales bacterium]|jgi:chorismate mutase